MPRHPVASAVPRFQYGVFWHSWGGPLRTGMNFMPLYVPWVCVVPLFAFETLHLLG